MKNIHVIPTSSPSKIFYIAENFHLEKGQLIEPKSYHNVYITSDEEIKDRNCWVTNGVEIFKPSDLPEYSLEYANRYWEKIILTTDPDLILDGVQEIPDDFLQWFVKNLTCERVEVKKKYSDFTVDPFVGYEIIIPKEEPKPFLDDSAFSLPDFNLSKNVFDKMSSLDNVKKTPKTETLKEAVDRLCYADQSMFVMGVNWQKERSFSKEEVLNIANWAFHFYKRNDLSDSELEEEFEKLLNETLTKK
jgi:hypothetical protein